MQLRYRYRLYPTPGQQRSLARAFGCARVVFNDAVAARRAAYAAGEKHPSSGAMQKTLITEAKRTPQRVWLGQVSNIVLQQAVRDCDQAYSNFFASLKGERKGRRVDRPRFWSRKDNRQAIRLHTGGFSIRGNGRLRVARVGDVAVAWSRDLPSSPSSVTISRTADGRFFCSFVVSIGDETRPPVLDRDGAEVETALDLGLNSFAVDQHGRVISNPRVLRRAERQLVKAQRELSRKQRGSANRAKARAKVARRHARVADTRADWLHKETSRLIGENQVVYLEDLNVAGLSPHTDGQIGAGRLLGPVSQAAGGESRAAWPRGGHHRQVRTNQPGVLRVRGAGRTQTPECAHLNLYGVRSRARSGRQRGPKHSRRRAGGETKRLWRPCKTPACWGCGW